jgi:sodium/hydrogen antiporter
MAFAGGHAAFADMEKLWAATALVIVLSSIVHGFTAGIVVKRYTDTTA